MCVYVCVRVCVYARVLTTVVSLLQVFTPLMLFTASAVFSYMHCSCVSRTNTDDTEVCLHCVGIPSLMYICIHKYGIIVCINNNV